MSEQLDQKQISRKDFLKGMGVTIGGIALAGTLGTTLIGCSTQSTTADTSQTPQYPFPYKKLDLDVVQERAFKGYKEKGGWGAGVAEGFFGTLADEVGYPFNQIPIGMFTNASSGYQISTLCGSLGTAAACIGTVCEPDVAKELIVKLQNWYKTAEFPTYQPEDLNLPTTVAESVLCADSVGKFMEKSGYEYDSSERKSRCAGVAGETARKMVELLNEKLGWSKSSFLK